jgi:hypothetical protein
MLGADVVHVTALFAAFVTVAVSFVVLLTLSDISFLSSDIFTPEELLSEGHETHRRGIKNNKNNFFMVNPF